MLELALQWVREIRKNEPERLKRILTKPTGDTPALLLGALLAYDELLDDIPF